MLCGSARLMTHSMAREMREATEGKSCARFEFLSPQDRNFEVKVTLEQPLARLREDAEKRIIDVEAGDAKQLPEPSES